MRVPLVLLAVVAALASPVPSARADSDSEVLRTFTPLGLVHEPSSRRLLLFGQVWATIPGTDNGMDGGGPLVRMERLRVLEVGEDGTRTLELPGVFVGLDPMVDPPLAAQEERPAPWTEAESSPLWLVDAAHQRVLVLAGTRQEQRRQWAAHVRGDVGLDEIFDPGKHPERGYVVAIDGPDARIARRREPDPTGVAEAERVRWEVDAARKRLIRRTAGVTDLDLSAEQLFGKPGARNPWAPSCELDRPSVIRLYPSADGGVWMSCYLQSAIRLSNEGRVLAGFSMPREVVAGASAGQATAILWRGDARTPAQAEEAAKALKAAGGVLDRLMRLPEGYPKVVPSDSIPGLRPGFHAVLLGVCPTPEADRILKLLQTVDPEIYGRPVRVPADACPQVDHSWTVIGPHDGMRGKPTRLQVAILLDQALQKRSFAVVSLRSRSGKVLQRTSIASDGCAPSTFSVTGRGRDRHVLGVRGYCQEGCTWQETLWRIDGEDAIQVTRSPGAERRTVAGCK